jgi:hypothetical protein
VRKVLVTTCSVPQSVSSVNIDVEPTGVRHNRASGRADTPRTNDVFYAFWTNGGATWSAPINVTSASRARTDGPVAGGDAVNRSFVRCTNNPTEAGFLGDYMWVALNSYVTEMWSGTIRADAMAPRGRAFITPSSAITTHATAIAGSDGQRAHVRAGGAHQP